MASTSRSYEVSAIVPKPLCLPQHGTAVCTEYLIPNVHVDNVDLPICGKGVILPGEGSCTRPGRGARTAMPAKDEGGDRWRPVQRRVCSRARSRSACTTAWRSPWRSTCQPATERFRYYLPLRPIATTTIRCLPVHNFCGARLDRSNSTSGKATSMPTWMSGAAASQVVSFGCSTATSKRTFTMSSNGSGISPGRTAKSAASANPISACCNGGWRSKSRRRLRASRPSTA